MKRGKRLLILGGILLVLCLATFALSKYEQKQEQIKISDAVILEIPAESVTALAWEYADGGLSFRKTETGWQYTEDEAFPVSEEKVLAILEHFERFGVTFTIEEVTDYGQYGLDDPECTMTIEAAGVTHTLKMGDMSLMDEQRYIDIGDGKVYLVAEDPAGYVDENLSSMILHDDTPGFETVVDIVFSGAENYTITRTDDSTASPNPDDIYFTDRDGKTLPLDTAQVKQYLNTVTALGLLEYVTYNATEEELAAYGLDTPELSATIRYSYTAEDETTVTDTCVFHLGQNREELAAQTAEEAGETPGAVTKYVRIGDSPIVYTLPDTDYAILSGAGYEDLRHKAVFNGDFGTVTAVEAVLEGKTYTLTYAPEDPEAEEPVYNWYYGETIVDIQAVSESLTGLTASSFTDETPTGQQEIALTLSLDNEQFPRITIGLYRYDGADCLAVVDDAPMCLTARTGVMTLVEAVWAIVLA